MSIVDYFISRRSSLKLTGCDILMLVKIFKGDILKQGLVTDVFFLGQLFKNTEDNLLEFARNMSRIDTKDFIDKKDLIALAEKADFMDKQGRMIEKSVRDLRHEMGLRKYHSIKFKK